MCSTLQPVYGSFSCRDPAVASGLWETWRARDSDERLQSCTIVTQPPNEFAERIRSRMPVVLDTDEARAWLDPGKREPGALLKILAPTPASLGRRMTLTVESAMFASMMQRLSRKCRSLGRIMAI